MKILIIEDDAKIADFLEDGFRKAGFLPDVASDGMKGLDLALIHEYAVAVVDLMLPTLDGLSIIEKMRDEGVATPVIILSAKGSVSDRVKGLRAGGDDYLAKPFSFSELLARVHALLRRIEGNLKPVAELEVADLVLDPWKREARRGDEVIPLHAREFALLELFMRHPGRVISKAAILEEIYDYNFDPQTNVVDVLIHRLRAKIDKDHEPKLIHTKRGMGYVLKAS